jgi:hypothetical protein
VTSFFTGKIQETLDPHGKEKLPRIFWVAFCFGKEIATSKGEGGKK